MITAIVSHTPPWVFCLLAALVALGLSQTRTRRVSRVRLLLLPLALLAMGLAALAPRFAAEPATAAAWLAALVVCAQLGRRIAPPAGATWLPAARLLQLPGSWLPLATILAVFLLRYTVAVALALHPDWQHLPAAMFPVSALYGAVSGLLLGRTLALLQIGQPQPQTRPVAAATIAGHA